MKAYLADIKTHLGHMEGPYASLSIRVDWIAVDATLIKRRFDLVEA